jgi:aconitate decarboxylase
MTADTTIPVEAETPLTSIRAGESASPLAHVGHKSAGQPTDPGGPTGRLASWLADTTLDDVPATVRERAKHLILDGMACALVGAQLPWSRTGVKAVTALDGTGGASLIGWGTRTTSATSAAMLNSSFIQGFELDDYHPEAPLHSNSLVLPAMLSAAHQVESVSGARFLLGAILGYETGPRVGRALGGLDMLSRGWHSGVVFGTLSAAAAAGTIYGLDGAGFEDALGMAATQSCGLMSAQFESMVKRMQHGFAARNGLTAAALAAGGYTGIKRVLERPYGGYLATFGQGHDTDATAIYRGLGSTWETQRIVVKAYAAMGLLHAAIDAALKLRATGEVVVDQIARIDIDMSEAPYSHGGWQATRPLTTIGAQMNVAYAVAVALLDGSVLIDQFSERRINSDDVWRLINRTHTHHEKSYDALPESQRLTTRLLITFVDGTTREQVISQPRGAGDRQLTNAQIVDKYRNLTHSVIEPDRRHAIENTVLGLETLDDIAILTGMLHPPVSSVLS